MAEFIVRNKDYATIEIFYDNGDNLPEQGGGVSPFDEQARAGNINVVGDSYSFESTPGEKPIKIRVSSDESAFTAYATRAHIDLLTEEELSSWVAPKPPTPLDRQLATIDQQILRYELAKDQECSMRPAGHFLVHNAAHECGDKKDQSILERRKARVDLILTNSKIPQEALRRLEVELTDYQQRQRSECAMVESGGNYLASSVAAECVEKFDAYIAYIQTKRDDLEVKVAGG